MVSQVWMDSLVHQVFQLQVHKDQQVWMVNLVKLQHVLNTMMEQVLNK